MRKGRHGEVKYLDQGHIASKLSRQNLNPGSLASEFGFWTTVSNCLHCPVIIKTDYLGQPCSVKASHFFLTLDKWRGFGHHDAYWMRALWLSVALRPSLANRDLDSWPWKMSKKEEVPRSSEHMWVTTTGPGQPGVLKCLQW